jgi:hypothetical protein
MCDQTISGVKAFKHLRNSSRGDGIICNCSYFLIHNLRYRILLYCIRGAETSEISEGYSKFGTLFSWEIYKLILHMNVRSDKKCQNYLTSIFQYVASNVIGRWSLLVCRRGFRRNLKWSIERIMLEFSCGH